MAQLVGIGYNTIIMATGKTKELQELSSKLPDLFTHKNWPGLWQMYNLLRKWPEIVGNDIAKNSEPAYIQNGTLWVYIENSVLMQHLHQQKPVLLKNIKALFPDAGIEDIRWAMQPAKPSRKSQQRAEHVAPPPDRKTQEEFEAMTATVEDKQCRKALQKLWKTFHSSTLPKNGSSD